MPLYTRKRPLGGEYYVFRDSIHNVIEIDDEADGRLLRQILDTKEMQRLRHIRQNGLAFLVYPSLETTRFPHILGSFHVGQKLVYSLNSRQPLTEEGIPASLRLDVQNCRAFCFASVLHDIGHGPLSHIWEDMIQNLGCTIPENHETWDRRIINSDETEIGALLGRLSSDLTNDR